MILESMGVRHFNREFVQNLVMPRIVVHVAIGLRISPAIQNCYLLDT